MSSYNLIGLMSGTSMDGLDIAYVQFYFSKENGWDFKITASFTAKYDCDTLEKLKNSKNLNSIDLLQLDRKLGLFFADAVNHFLSSHEIYPKEIDAICSHGHTIFHQPEHGITLQIGCGEVLAFHTGIRVLNDFRKKDVVAGGQGAPLVPIGDKLLFSKYADAFLNIGGFTNICFPGEITKAHDISPGNLPLNYFSEKLGFDYDAEGNLSRKGNIDEITLEKLNALPYYHLTGPKSLGTEWLETNFMNCFSTEKSHYDNLRTITEHIAQKISEDLNKNDVKSVFITGGGAKNDFLIERIKHYYSGEVKIPSNQIIDYKEALIFAFLGALYFEQQANSLSSVTGAKKETIGGVLHLPH